MHIIFGDAAGVLADRYTVLELDTFKFPNKPDPIKTFCVVAQPPVEELPNLQHYKGVHAELIKQYRDKNWKYCEMAIQTLKGRWGGEVDSFYEDLQKRVDHFVENSPPEDWDWTILKTQ